MKDKYKKLFAKNNDSTIEQEIEEWVNELKQTTLKEVLSKALGTNKKLSITIPSMILSDTFNIQGRTFEKQYIYTQEEIVIEQNSRKKVKMIIAENNDVDYKKTIDSISSMLINKDFDSLPISFNIRLQEAKNILFYINFLKPLALKINC